MSKLFIKTFVIIVAGCTILFAVSKLEYADEGIRIVTETGEEVFATPPLEEVEKMFNECGKTLSLHCPK